MVNLGSHTQKSSNMARIWKNLGEPFFSKEKAGIAALTPLIESFFFRFLRSKKGMRASQRFHKIMMSQVIQLKTHSFRKFTLELAQTQKKRKMTQKGRVSNSNMNRSLCNIF